MNRRAIRWQERVRPGVLPPDAGRGQPGSLGPRLDTSKIVYRREEGSSGYTYLRWMNADGTDEQDLWGERILLHGRLGYQHTSYTFTPDGRTVVYSDREGTYLKQRGRERRKILDGVTGGLDVSPDGRKLAYTRYSSTTRADVYISNLDGTGERLLTDAPRDDVYPSWTRDGRKILYSEGANNWLMIMNTDGSGKMPLSDDLSPSAVRYQSASWSPDGRKLVAIGYQSGQWHVYTLNADSTAPRRLTEGVLQHFMPRWSPDGSKILFARRLSSRSDANSDIFLMNPDGSGIVNLTNTPSVAKSMPRWLPSSVQLVNPRPGLEPRR